MTEVIIDPTDGQQLARPALAAKLVGVSPRTIYHWIATKRVRVRYMISGAVLVDVASLFTSERPRNARSGRSAGLAGLAADQGDQGDRPDASVQPAA